MPHFYTSLRPVAIQSPFLSITPGWQMIGLLQRVSSAHVAVGEAVVGRIGTGILVLVGVERGDGEAQADRLLERLLGYRIFPDLEGRMNLSVRDIQGDLMLVPQFTLAADTRKGTRPGFQTAAAPAEAHRLFDYLVVKARECAASVQTGMFGADMQVTLCNDGPVTFWLRTAPEEGPGG